MSTITSSLLLVALRDPSVAALAFGMHLPFSAAEAAAEAAERILLLLRRHGRRPPRLQADPGAEALTADETAVLRLLAALAAGERALAGLLLQWLVRPTGQAALAGEVGRLLRAAPLTVAA